MPASVREEQSFYHPAVAHTQENLHCFTAVVLRFSIPVWAVKGAEIF
jgi:hypothetical protein